LHTPSKFVFCNGELILQNGIFQTFFTEMMWEVGIYSQNSHHLVQKDTKCEELCKKGASIGMRHK